MSLFNTLSNWLSLVNNYLLTYILLKFDLVEIDHVLLKKYFKTEFVNRTLDFQFYAILSVHMWNMNFG